MLRPGPVSAREGEEGVGPERGDEPGSLGRGGMGTSAHLQHGLPKLLGWEPDGEAWRNGAERSNSGNNGQAGWQLLHGEEEQ